MALVRLLCSGNGVPLCLGSLRLLLKRAGQCKQAPSLTHSIEILYHSLQASRRCSRFWLGNTWWALRR